jgi:hypothetical protein
MFTKQRLPRQGIPKWKTGSRWKTSKPDDHDFAQVDFRHEIEFGITNRRQAAIYLADWNHTHGAPVDDPGFMYSASAIELVYNLTGPGDGRGWPFSVSGSEGKSSLP